MSSTEVAGSVFDLMEICKLYFEMKNIYKSDKVYHKKKHPRSFIFVPLEAIQSLVFDLYTKYDSFDIKPKKWKGELYNVNVCTDLYKFR